MVGLAKAGKTSIKNIFFENWSKKQVQEIRPTVDVAITHKFQDFLKQRLTVMDFGGQLVYREKHLTREEIWRGLSALILVVDIQDEASFECSRDYLRGVWKIVTSENDKKPKLTIFFHKYDLEKRGELKDNLRRCLSVFSPFFKFSTFHLTTIEDSSCNEAMVKTLFLSIPWVIIKRLLEEEVVDYFEKKILAEISEIPKSKIGPDTFENLDQKFYQKMLQAGHYCSLSLQKSWMEYLIGEWRPSERLLSSKSVSIVQSGKSLLMEITDWEISGVHNVVINRLFKWFLIGILNTFSLGYPELVEDDSTRTTWKILM